MKLLKGGLWVALTSCYLFAFGAEVRTNQENPNLLAFGSGVYDIFRYNHRYVTGLLQLEYKGPSFFGKNLLNVRPFAALMGNFQGSVWIGGGVNFDIIATHPIIITLGFGPGFFYRGKGKDLGYPLEIRSSAEIAYRFKSYARAGFQFYHLSNASLSLRRNPGTECLVFFYAIPL
jgi:hypothetical protein